MHLLALRAIVNSLADALCGRRVRRAGMLAGDTLGLWIEAEAGAPRTLVLSAQPGAPHARLDEGRPRFRRSLTEQLGGAAATLAGARLKDITQLGWERLLLIRLAPHAGASDARSLLLVLELLPRTPYLIVAAGDPPEILAAIRAPGTHRPDRRAMERGAPYQPPFGLPLEPLLADPRGAAARATSLRGVAAAEIQALTEGAGSAGERQQRLLAYSGPLVVRADAGGPPRLLPALPGADRPAEDDARPALAAVTAWLEAFAASALEQRARRAIEAHLRREGRRLARRRRAAERDAAAGGSDPRRLRHQAEALLAHLHQVERGSTSVRLPDPYGGEPLQIELDPRLRPAAAAEALFERARRLERRREQLGTRLRALDATAAELDASARLVAEGDGAAIVEHARELVEQGILEATVLEAGDTDHRGSAARRGGARAGRAAPQQRRPYRVFRLASGWEAWVGRSNADNDILTHRLAAPHDLWLHAYGASGAHVILRRPAGRRSAPPRSIVEAAAGIAAHFSRARHSRQVPVMVTERRYVRRPRRSPPGTAVALRERTIMAEPRLPEAAGAGDASGAPRPAAPSHRPAGRRRR